MTYLKKLFLVFSLLGFLHQLNAQITFSKTFGGTGDDFALTGFLTDDKDYIAVGYTSSYGSGGIDAYILKIDTLGNEIWNKTIGGTANDAFYNGIELSNGDLVFVGFTSSYGNEGADGIVVKTDYLGNVLWTETFGGLDDENLGGIVETTSGHLLVTGYTKSYGAGDRDFLVFKLDLNGNLIWSKTFGNSSNDWTKIEAVKETSNGNFIIAGPSFNSGLAQHNGLRIEIDSSGVLVDSKLYGGSGNYGFKEVALVSDATYLWGDCYVNSNHVLWLNKLEGNNTLDWSKTYTISNEDVVITSGFIDENELTFTGYEHTNSGQGDAFITKLSVDGDVLWTKSFGGSNLDAFRNVRRIDSGYLIIGHTDNYGEGGKDILFLKTDNYGNIEGCTNSITMVESSINPSIVTPTLTANTQTLGESATVLSSSQTTSDNWICLPESPIANFEMSDSVICQNECIDLVESSSNADQWSWTIAGANITNSNDEAIYNVCFENMGTFSIQLIASNGNVSDTITKTIIVNPRHDVNLGMDTMICENEQLVLDASHNNATYLWSDNSTEEMLNVNSSGAYWVAVTVGVCEVRDTIQVTLLDTTSFDLGKDTIICNADFLALTITGEGAGSYEWHDGSEDATYVAYTSGVYSVEVTSNCGVFTDSIALTFLDSDLMLDLGNDTVLCSGESLELDITQDNVDFYVWQNDTASPIFTINQPGTYIATISNLCEAVTDTIVVLHDTISLDLGRDTLLVCENENYLLTAFHPNALYYEWNTGDTDYAINLTESGVYTVEIGSYCDTLVDSIYIVLNQPIVPLDLGNTQNICEGDTIWLDATSENGIWYEWQDSSTSPVLEVTSPGIYEVFVGNGCGEITDKININNKDCCSLYVPNVFTPNGDSQNDVFKVYQALEGCLDVVDFSLKIFNRWGGVVYASNDINQGWDGYSENEKVGVGTYLYLVEYSDGQDNFVLSGDINVLKY